MNLGAHLEHVFMWYYIVDVHITMASQTLYVSKSDLVINIAGSPQCKDASNEWDHNKQCTQEIRYYEGPKWKFCHAARSRYCSCITSSIEDKVKLSEDNSGPGDHGEYKE